MSYISAVRWNYNGQQTIERYMSNVRGFNRGKRPRRPWQNSDAMQVREKYIATCNIFTRIKPYPSSAKREQVDYDQKGWLTEALERLGDSKWFMNDSKPKYYDYSGSKLMQLFETNDPIYHRGDVILVTFRLGFTVRDTWTSELMPFEFTRVGRLPDHLITGNNEQYKRWPDNKVEDLAVGELLKPIEGWLSTVTQASPSVDSCFVLLE